MELPDDGSKRLYCYCSEPQGNSGFGQAWKEQISGDYGGANIQDYLDATDAMAKEPYVDAEDWEQSEPAMEDIQFFILQECMEEDLKHLYLTAECSILQAGMDQLKSYGSLIRILKDLLEYTKKL